MKKRILSTLLVIAMLVGMIVIPAYADTVTADSVTLTSSTEAYLTIEDSSLFIGATSFKIYAVAETVMTDEEGNVAYTSIDDCTTNGIYETEATFIQFLSDSEITADGITEVFSVTAVTGGKSGTGTFGSALADGTYWLFAFPQTAGINNAIYGVGTLPIASTPQITVTWDVNYSGGTNTTVPIEKGDGEVQIVVPADPTREGYHFLGWSTSEDDTSLSNGIEPTDGKLTITPNKDYTYYAQWAQLFTVTYYVNKNTNTTRYSGAYKNGETELGDSFTEQHWVGETVTLPTLTYTETTNEGDYGQTLLGWKLENAGENLNGTYTMGNAARSYTAQWEAPGPVEVTVEDIVLTIPDDNSGVTLTDKYTVTSADYDSSLTPTVTPNGTGVFTYADGKVTPVAIGTGTITLAFPTDDANNLHGKSYTINVTVKAKYKVSFDKGDTDAGGSMTDAYTTAAASTAGEEISYTLPANGFTAPTGKVFDKWKIGENTYDAGEAVTLTGDTTVTAIWKTATYTVTYKDGDNTVDTETVNYGTALKDLTLPAARSDTATKHFVGWGTDASDSTTVITSATTGTVTDNITIYAVWVDHTYAVSVSPDAEESFNATGVEYPQDSYTQPDAKTVTFTNSGTGTQTLTVSWTGGDFIIKDSDNQTFSSGANWSNLTAGADFALTVQPKTGLAMGTHTVTITVKGDQAKSNASDNTVTKTYTFTVGASEAQVGKPSVVVTANDNTTAGGQGAATVTLDTEKGNRYQLYKYGTSAYAVYGGLTAYSTGTVNLTDLPYGKYAIAASDSTTAHAPSEMAYFEINYDYTVSFEVGANGSGSADSVTVHTENGALTMTYTLPTSLPSGISANAGYEFSKWTGDSNYTINDGDTSVTLNGKDLTITAQFAAKDIALAKPDDITDTVTNDFTDVVFAAATYDDAVKSAIESSVNVTYTLTGDYATYGFSFDPATRTLSHTGKLAKATPDGGITLTLTATAANGKSASQDFKLTVNKKAIADADVTIAADFTYNGTLQTPVESVTVNGVTLTKDTDYTVTVTSETDAGTYDIKITGTNNYSGEVTKQWEIKKLDISKPAANTTVTLDGGGNSLIYNAAEQTQTVTSVTVQPASSVLTLTAGTDYTVSGNEGTNAGDYTLTITGAGTNYTGSVEKAWSIGKLDLADSSVDITVAETTYNGSEQTANVTVKVGSNTLDPANYTVSNNKHTDAGTYTDVTVSYNGGNTQGSDTATWVIKQATMTLNAGGNITDGVSIDNAKSLTGHAYGESTDVDPVSTDDYTIVYSTADANASITDDDFTATVAGTYTVTATLTLKGKGLTNYTLGAGVTELTGTFQITAGDLPKYTIGDLADQELTYGGDSAELTLTVTDADSNAVTSAEKITVTSGDTTKVTASYADGKITVSPVGATAEGTPVTVTVTVAPTSKNATTTKTFNVTVKKATATFTVDNSEIKYYNGAEQAADNKVTVTGVTADGTIDGSKYSVSHNVTPKDANTYTVSVTLTDTGLLANYNEAAALATGGNSDWTITPKPIDVEGTVTKVYDGNANVGSSTFSLTAASGVTGETITITAATGSYNAATVAGANTFTVDTITATVSGGQADINNYSIDKTQNRNNVTGTITRATITVKANDNSITYGDAPAGNGFTYDGFVNSETESVISGTPAYTYNYAQYDNVGSSYTITPDISGLSADNYTFSLATPATGTLTVGQLTATLSWSNTSVEYNTNKQKPTATVTNAVNGDELTVSVSVAGDADGKADADTYTATATAITGAKSGNYKLPDDPTTSFEITAVQLPTPESVSASASLSGLVISIDVTPIGAVTGGTAQYQLLLDGVVVTAWQTGTTFTGLQANKTYTVQAKYVANNTNYLDSTGVASTTVTTPDAPDYTFTVVPDATSQTKVYKETPDAFNITVTNVGNRDDQTITLEISDTANFTLNKASTSALAKTNGADSTVTITPASNLSVGTYTVTLTAKNTNDPAKDQTLTLTFTVEAKKLTAADLTNNLTFNEITYGDTVTSATVKSGSITATGATVSLSGVTFTPASTDKGEDIAVTVTVPASAITITDTNYALPDSDLVITADGKLKINAKDVTVKVKSGETLTKTYDGTTAIGDNASKLELDGILDADKTAVTLNTSAAVYNSKDVASANKITGLALSGNDKGNYNLTNTEISAVITKAEAKFSVSATLTYNGEDRKGDVTVTITGVTVSGTPETLSAAATTYAYDGSITTNVVKAGEYTVAITVSDGNYETNAVASGANADKFTIAKANLTVSGYPANAEVYSGTAVPALSGVTVTGVKSGDPASSEVTIAWDDSTAITGSVGANVTRKVQVTLSGDAAINYNTVSDHDVTFTIKSADEVTIALSKTSDDYTGNDIALPTVTVSFGGLTLTEGTDYEIEWKKDSTAVTTAHNAGEYTVTVTSKDTAKYTIPATYANTYTVNKVAATFTLVNASKEYNANDQEPGVTVTGTTADGTLAASLYTVKYNGSDTKPHDADDYTVTIVMDADSNYTSPADGLTFTITPVTVTLNSDAVASDKTYDGTKTATITTAPTLSGVLAADASNVSVSVSNAEFEDENASATAKNVTFTAALTGSASGNYTLSSTSGATTAKINKANVTVTITHPVGAELTVDGGTVLGTVTLDGTHVRESTTVNVPGTLAWDNGTAEIKGSTKTHGWTFTPTDTTNYNGATGNITFIIGNLPTPTVTYSAENSEATYDGAQHAITVTAATNGAAAGDFTVHYTGTTLAGDSYDSDTAPTEAGTYTVSAVSTNSDYNNASNTTTLTILPKALAWTLTSSTAAKNYDGSATTEVTAAVVDITGEVSGENVTAALKANTSKTFASKNHGSAYAYTLTADDFTFTHDGGENKLANYTLPTTDLTANNGKINVITVDFTLPTITKVYDGGNALGAASQTALDGVTLTGVIASEASSVKLDYSGVTYASKDKGAAIALIGSFALTNNADGNYALTQPTSPTGEITAKEVSFTLPAIAKTYDGTESIEAADVTAIEAAALTGAVAGENVYVVVGTAKYASKDASDSAIAITGAFALGGTDAANYTLTQPTNPTGTISKAQLQTSTLRAEKDYDGSDTVAIGEFETAYTVVNGVNGEKFNLTGITGARYATSNAHTSYTAFAAKGTVSLTPADLSAKASNYDLTDLSNITMEGKINKVNQTALTITPDTATTVEYGDTVTVTVSGGSGTGALTYTSSNPSVATVDANTGAVTILKPGTFTITATKAADTNYNVAAATTATVTVTKRAITVNDTVLDSIANGDTGFKLADKITAQNLPAAAATKPVFEFSVTTAGDLNAHKDGDYLKWTVDTTRTANATAVVTASLSTASQEYYTMSDTDVTVTLQAKEVATVTIASSITDKDYDGNTITADDVKAATTVTVPANADRSNITVTITKDGVDVTADGITDAGTYVVTVTYSDATYYGAETKTITVEPYDLKNVIDALTFKKTYDGTAAAAIGDITSATVDKTAGTINGVNGEKLGFAIGTDTVYSSAAAENGKNVTLNKVTVSNNGTAKASNYKYDTVAFADGTEKTISATLTGAGTIERKTLTWIDPAVSAAALDKDYDGGRNAELSANVSLTAKDYLVGIVDADASLQLVIAAGTYTNAFEAKDVGEQKVTFPTSALTLSDNYDLPASGTGIKAEIKAASATLTAKDSVSTTVGSYKPSDFVKSDEIEDNGESVNDVYGSSMTLNPGDENTNTPTTLTAEAKDDSDHVVSTLTVTIYTVKEGVTYDEAAGEWKDENGATLTDPADIFEPYYGSSLEAGVEYYALIGTTDTTTPFQSGNYSLTGFAAPAGTNVTDFVKLTASNPPAPAAPGASTFTVTYVIGNNGSVAEGTELTETVAKGEKPANVPSVSANYGYNFVGWTDADGKTVDPTEVEINEDTTFTAAYSSIFYRDHILYMVGRTPGKFEPRGNLTRAEAVTILSRLVNGFSEDVNYTGADFKDVKTTAWYYKYVSFGVNNGLVTGYKDGTFKPQQPVTRQEFAAMLARFLKLNIEDKKSTFTDARNNWAKGYIAALQDAGIISGYPDGTFKQMNLITRAEAVTMVNAAIDRVPDDDLDISKFGLVNPWTDVKENHWFYANVMEATLEHETEDFHQHKYGK